MSSVGPANEVGDPELSHRYERERAAILRRRLMWYCGVVVGLALLSAGANYFDLATKPREPAARQITLLDLTADLVLIGLHVCAFAYVAGRQISRERIVAIVSWLIALGGAVAIVVTPIVEKVSPIVGTAQGSAVGAGLATLLTMFVLHFLASALVSLSPHEGLRALLPLVGVFVVTTVVLLEAPEETKVALIAASPLAGLPGLLWSWWRHRSFAEQVRNRFVRDRYLEISRDLADARQLHEALFPPPVTLGPLRLIYRYEPARHIGGDFLFVHYPTRRTAVPGAEHPLTAVLLDVTGHGISAALAVNRLYVELNRIYADEPETSPAECLTLLNEFAYRELAKHGIFATAVCLRVRLAAPGGPRVEWAGAGHPPALLLNGTPTPRRLQSDAPPLGVLEDEAFAAQCVTQEAAFDGAIVAYTDGLSEARSVNGAMFGTETVEALLIEREAFRDGSVVEGGAVKLLVGAVNAFRDGPPRDDLLIVEIFRAPRVPAGAEHMATGLTSSRQP